MRFAAVTVVLAITRVGSGASIGPPPPDGGCVGATGSCFEPHAEPGCEIIACCKKVCAQDPLCCEQAWDELCVDAATALCNACNGAEGSCFEANGSPGCDDFECCKTVCELDPFCCDTEWDKICVGEALDLCVDEPNACVGAEGDCFVPNGTPGCDELDCCKLVCEADDFCCEIQWDAACVTQAGVLCSACQDAEGDCSEPNGTPGCDDLECCLLVCERDPTCCDFAWDAECVAQAAAVCPTHPQNACMDAVAILPGVTPFDNTGSSLDGPVPCGVLGADIWYDYTAEVTGTLVVNTCGSTFDTVLAIYEGCDCPADEDTLLACNDDAVTGPCVGTVQSEVVVEVMAGGCYKLQVAGFNGNQGAGVIHLEGPAPCESCPGDLDCDGVVTVEDLVVVILDWGCSGPPFACRGDVDGDGVTAVSDLVDVILNWGPCASP